MNNKTIKQTLEQMGINIPENELMICDGLEEIISLPDFVEKFCENLIENIRKSFCESKN